MSDINQIRRFLYNKQPGKKGVLSEGTSVTVEVIGGVPSAGLKAGQTFHVSSIAELLKKFRASEVGSGSDQLEQLEKAFTQGGRTIYAFLDPYALVVDKVREVDFALSRRLAQEKYNKHADEI